MLYGIIFLKERKLLGRLVRVLFALTAIAPISISMGYIYAVREQNLKLAFAALLVCAFLGWLSVWIVERARTRLEHLPIIIKKAKSADKEVIGFFVAYALPLIFRGDASPDMGAWLLASMMLLFVLFSTHTLQVNPVLGILGFHFYEVETSDGITYLLITRRKISNVLSVNCVVQLSEYGILEAKHKKGKI